MRADDESEIRVTAQELPDGIRLVVTGALDLANAAPVARLLRDAARDLDVVVIDLDAVTFLDSQGVAELHHLHQELTGAGRVLQVAAAPDSVAGKVLRLTHLDTVWTSPLEAGSVEVGTPAEIQADEPAEGWLADTRRWYDDDASGYTEEVRGLLERQPALRAGLDLFADRVRAAGGGPVADVGCGPGYVTAYLHDAGLDAFGIDLSPEMVAIARRDHPLLRFDVGTMTALDLADGSIAGLVAFWSVIHIPDHAMPGVCEQFHRVLCPNGLLLVGFHVGDGTRHSSQDSPAGPRTVDSRRRRPGTVAGWLRRAGFRLEAELVNRPDDDVPGALLLARRTR